MDLVKVHNERYAFFRKITGIAMKVHSNYKPGLLESAYEAAMQYLLIQDGFAVQRQALLPIYWEDVKLDQTYRMDLVVDNNIILELKAVHYVDSSHRKQLWNYMNLTHLQYGMLLNFGADSLYSEWYERDASTGRIGKIRLL